ncbi:MAG: ABC transporter permease subunit [Candidatus Thalassarchaeaceae archaeon]|nr:ABC transporter permease subunit [Candidatus Thalassarchaeaceae archaeon]
MIDSQLPPNDPPLLPTTQNKSPPSDRVKSLAETVWTKLDRKATAIAEFTMRQYRKKRSTWVVGFVGFLLITLVLLFYIEAMAQGFEGIDQDEDSEDYDGDGYPTGQEKAFGTDPNWYMDYPGSPEFIDDGNWYTDSFSGNGTFSGRGEFTFDWLNNSIPEGQNQSDQQRNRWGIWWHHIYVNDLPDCIGNEPQLGNNEYWAGGCWVDNNTIRTIGRYISGNGTFTPESQWNGFSFGEYDSGFYVEPDLESDWIDEDKIDWDGSEEPNQGFDDDGDCLSLDDPWERDKNGDGIECNVLYVWENGELVDIKRDTNVDEDPDDSEFLKEGVHRAFLLGFGKFGYLFIMAIFIPLFLATGLIRDEQEEGTLHYLVGKPIARAEVLMYRLLGFIGLAWPYLFVLVFCTALVTGFFGPGESFYRFSDLGIWFGVFIAVCLTVLAYAAIFATFGIITPKYGVIVSLLFAFYEFVMIFLSMMEVTRNMGLATMSVSFWGCEIINSTSWLVWSDQLLLQQQAEAFGWAAEGPLWLIWLSPFPTIYPLVNFALSIIVLILLTAVFVLIGQRSFKRRELN